MSTRDAHATEHCPVIVNVYVNGEQVHSHRTPAGLAALLARLEAAIERGEIMAGELAQSVTDLQGSQTEQAAAFGELSTQLGQAIAVLVDAQATKAERDKAVVDIQAVKATMDATNTALRAAAAEVDAADGDA